jgi:hypothetical protein
MMKRILYIIIGVTLLLTSCDKEDSANGNLDGFWQMTMMLNKVDATNSDMRLSGITWAFQGHILELRDVNKVNQDIIMSFNHDGNKLKLYEPYRVDRDSNDIIINDVAFLLPYGIESTTVEYNVIELSNSCMILDNNVWHLEFRKY